MIWPHSPLTAAQLAQTSAQLLPGTQGFIPGYGPKTPRLILVGEAPGETEVTSLRPFTGRAGAKLDLMLEALGQTRASVFITMSFHRRPVRLKPNGKWGNRPPTAREVAADAWLLDAELAALPPVPIVAMGAVACQRLLGQPLAAVRGTVCQRPLLRRQADGYVATDSRLVAACAHPAALLYRRATQTQTLAELHQIRAILEESFRC